MDFYKSLDMMQQQYQQHLQTFLEDDDDNNSHSSSSLDEDNDLIMNDDFEEIIYGGGSGKHLHGAEGVNNNNAHSKQCKSSKLDRVKRIIDNSGRKRRIYSTIHNDPKQSTRRFRANDRERRRMNSLNGALQALKGCVPSYHGKKRLTKLQILKFACHYISDLSDLLCTNTTITSSDVSCENNNIMNTKIYQQQQQQQQQHQHQHQQHQQQQQISPAIPQPPPTTTTVTPDCNTSYSSVDSFMSIMADQQHQHQQQQQRNIINQPHFQSNMAITTAADQNINGMSMLQRLDYLTFHGFMAAVTDNNNNNNNNMSTGLSGSNNSDFFQMGIPVTPINNQQHLYGF